MENKTKRKTTNPAYYLDFAYGLSLKKAKWDLYGHRAPTVPHLAAVVHEKNTPENTDKIWRCLAPGTPDHMTAGYEHIQRSCWHTAGA